MGFFHCTTGKEYKTIAEKIKYYSKRAYNDKTVTAGQKAYALKRLNELKELSKRTFDEPTMIVTNDKHFGNKDKPRACVVVGKDNQQRLIVCPVHDRASKSIILDNDYTRQVDSQERKIAPSEVYELSDISGLKPLTENDKRKLRYLHPKK